MKKREYFHFDFREWKTEFKEHWKLILISLVLLLISIIIDYASGFYVTYKADVQTVPDLILKYFGPYNFGFLYTYGFLLLFIIFYGYALFYEIKRLHIILFYFSFSLVLRSVFITFTHLRTPIEAIPVSFPSFLNIFRFQNDQFYSGHVAVPFLAFLIFKDSKIKYFFLIGSIIMSITVLAMHQHYSIDVLAAFFITYGGYKISEKIVQKFKEIKWLKIK